MLVAGDLGAFQYAPASSMGYVLMTEVGDK